MTLRTNLMWAYGSNLNVEQMRYRCPTAVPVAPLIVPNAILRFRSIADVAYLSGATCAGGLWQITETDEKTLDEYEGVDVGLYEKKYLLLLIDGKAKRALFYKMLRCHIAPPSPAYLSVIRRGYQEFNLPLHKLKRAVAHAKRKRLAAELALRRPATWQWEPNDEDYFNLTEEKNDAVQHP